MADIRGIVQSDVLIRAALVYGLQELRQQPWLLDYCFAWMKQDDRTADVYGQREIDRAKEWFLATNVEVKLRPEINTPTYPSVIISLAESTEIANTTADTHYEVAESDSSVWPPLAGPFHPVSYDQATGRLVLPDLGIAVVPGMVVVDRVGRMYEIIAMDEDAVYLPAHSQPDLAGAVIKGAQPSRVITLESARFRETYQLTCVVNTQMPHLTYLHSIVTFLLLRGRQHLLEARGLQCSQLQSAEAVRHELEEGIAWVRYMTVTGEVQHVWPKARQDSSYSVEFRPSVAQVGSTVQTFSAHDDPETEAWLAQDPLDLLR